MATDPFAALAGASNAPDMSGLGGMAPDVMTAALPQTQAAPAAPGGSVFDIGLSAFGTTQEAPPPPTPAIDKLQPRSELHGKVLAQLDARAKFSRNEMKKHYARWNFNEQKIQAYAGAADYERLVEPFRYKKGASPPQPFQIIVPYSYATIHAAATFVSTVLLGRKPVFPLLATRGTQTDRARHMESALQAHLDASRGYEMLWQGIWDSFVYGFGPKRVNWEERTGPAIKWVGGQRTQVTETTFAGNVLTALDPYAFLPDPRVPIHQCNVKGDFCFSEVPMSEMILNDMEKQGMLSHVKAGLEQVKNSGKQGAANEAMRRVRIGLGVDIQQTPSTVTGHYPMLEGTVRIVPKDWGLGDGDQSELWKFSWFEGKQIMQAEPLGMMHGQHPYVAAEPTSFGHDFMSLSMADMIGNFQDMLSWLVSSRMENVRSVVNNAFVADPARVEINDIRSSPIGRIIRLKQTAMGLPVKEAIMQLVTQDVTMGHLTDMQNMRVLADTITGVNDNMRGIQTQGGRRSATEARISMQNGGSRMSQHAVRISAQSYHPMVQQMLMNIQQFMPDSMWVEMTGDTAPGQSMELTPEMLVGSYNFQVSDGTLPYDKTAMLEVWKEILMGVAQDPELRQGHDINKIFQYVAELGGAKNIDSFKKQQPMVQANAMADPASDPNMQAIGPAMPAGPLPAGLFQG